MITQTGTMLQQAIWVEGYFVLFLFSKLLYKPEIISPKAKLFFDVKLIKFLNNNKKRGIEETAKVRTFED